MEVLNMIELMEKYCAHTNTWGIYISTQNNVGIEELKKAIPYLQFDELVFLVGGRLVLSFDTEAEMLECYNQTVGDDGPTKTNTYNGPVRVYAVTCNNKGVIQNENT